MSIGDAPVEARADAPQARRLYFYGTGGTLFGIHIVNILLTILTLGIYYFWGKVRVRAYLLGQSEFQGDRFAFHGTGKELLIGWLKAALVFGVPVFVLSTVPQLLDVPTALQGAALIVLYALFLLFIPVAMVGARRYRLSRTSWRGIRFSFRGGTRAFVKLFVKGALLTLVTLGLYYPVFEARRYDFMTSHSYFGNRRFGFDGRGQDLLGVYLLAFLLFGFALGGYVLIFWLWIPIFNLNPAFYVFPFLLLAAIIAACWSWFSARKQRYFWDHTAFDGARFHSTVTGGRLFRLKFANLLLLVFTVGLAWSWVTVRNARFAFRYLTLEGVLDLAGIQQEAQLATATGEGLAGFLDVGTDLG